MVDWTFYQYFVVFSISDVLSLKESVGDSPHGTVVKSLFARQSCCVVDSIVAVAL